MGGYGACTDEQISRDELAGALESLRRVLAAIPLSLLVDDSSTR